jgi:hypothetical protein
VDWLLVVLGPIGLAGLIAFHRQIRYRGRWEHITHWLIVVHLGASVVVHVWILVAQSHAVLSVFPPDYSDFAVVYFAFFAWRSWSLRLEPVPAGKR